MMLVFLVIRTSVWLLGMLGFRVLPCMVLVFASLVIRTWVWLFAMLRFVVPCMMLVFVGLVGTI